MHRFTIFLRILITMRETETFDYIRQKYQSEKETWMMVRHLVKFDEQMRIRSVHDFDIDVYVSSFGRLMRNGTVCNMSYGEKYDISSMFTDTVGRKVRFKRHQIVLQTFNPCERRQYDTVDHINNRERFDNSIFNLRWADKRTQVENRRDKPGKKRYVCCIGDDEIYSSCAEVERLFGLPKNTVSKVCRGELEQIDGYRFYYL